MAALTAADQHDLAAALGRHVISGDWDHTQTLLSSIPADLAPEVPAWIERTVADVCALQTALTENPEAVSPELIKILHASWATTKLANVTKIRHRLRAHATQLDTQIVEFPTAAPTTPEPVPAQVLRKRPAADSDDAGAAKRTRRPENSPDHAPDEQVDEITSAMMDETADDPQDEQQDEQQDEYGGNSLTVEQTDKLQLFRLMFQVRPL